MVYRSFRNPGPMSAPDAGICLLALRILRKHGLACPTEAEILALRGVNVSDADELEQASFEHEYTTQAWLVDGMMQNAPEPPPPIDPPSPTVSFKYIYT
jgi:hypothetical protein